MQASQSFPATASLPRPRFGWVRPGFAGHLLTIITVAVLAAGLAATDGAEIIAFFVVPVTVVTIAFAALAVRFARWGHIAGIVGGLALLAMALPEVPNIADHFDSFYDTVPALGFGVAGLVMAGTSIAGVARKSLDRTTAWAGAFTVLGAIVIVGAISGVATITGQETVSAQERAGATDFRMEDVKFATSEITASEGQRLKFVADNADPIIHTFTIKELDIDVTVKPGSEKLVEFVAPNAGTYEIVCAVSGHGKMKTILNVTER